METTPRQEALYELARQCGQMFECAIRSGSGTDQAESEVHACARRVYVAVAGGENLEAALALEDNRWRAYAAEQAAKVARAPKIRRGPCAGHSAIGHRWVSPEKFAATALHIRAMVRIIDERLAK